MTESTKQEARDQIKKMLKPGDTIHAVLRHVSRSGMSRRIDLFLIKDGTPRLLSGFISRAMGMQWPPADEGIKVTGCGMDMGFALVYDLARTLYPDGFGCAGEKCPSNDHSNGDRDYTPHNHNDGGYAFRCQWM